MLFVFLLPILNILIWSHPILSQTPESGAEAQAGAFENAETMTSRLIDAVRAKNLEGLKQIVVFNGRVETELLDFLPRKLFKEAASDIEMSSFKAFLLPRVKTDASSNSVAFAFEAYYWMGGSKHRKIFEAEIKSIKGSRYGSKFTKLDWY